MQQEVFPKLLFTNSRRANCMAISKAQSIKLIHSKLKRVKSFQQVANGVCMLRSVSEKCLGFTYLVVCFWYLYKIE